MSAAPNLVPFPALSRRAKKQPDQQARLKKQIDKADSILTRLEDEAKEIDQQIKQLKAAKEFKLRWAERIENGILAQMQKYRASELIGNQVTFSTRHNAPALQVLDQSKIPDRYIRERLVCEPDKLQIKAALSRGEEIDGVALVQTISLLRKR